MYRRVPLINPFPSLPLSPYLKKKVIYLDERIHVSVTIKSTVTFLVLKIVKLRIKKSSEHSLLLRHACLNTSHLFLIGEWQREGGGGGGGGGGQDEIVSGTLWCM